MDEDAPDCLKGHILVFTLRREGPKVASYLGMLNPSFKADMIHIHSFLHLLALRRRYFTLIILHLCSLASLNQYVLYKYLYVRASTSITPILHSY